MSKESAHLYTHLMALLDKAGVPQNTRWRSLLLYLREIKDYPHLSDAQKMTIHTLMADITSSRDYSEANLRHLLTSYRDCIVNPYKEKIAALLAEANTIIQEFQKILSQRRANFDDLEETTITIVKKSEDSQKQIEELQEAFSQIKTFFANDLRSLENLATRDALTGLHNRRAFDEFMTIGIEAWRVNDRPLALALFDIDHFKALNDTHGHRIGDQVLALVSKQMSKAAENISVGNKVCLARFGGEEFVLVISGKGISQIADLVENIRSSIKQFNFLIRDAAGNVLEDGVHITISAGIASMSREWDAMHLENLIDCADKALYYAKHHGRDKAVIFQHGGKHNFTVVPQPKDARAKSM
jgi:diguanylate cyclase (GGDEF)-like protein